MRTSLAEPDLRMTVDKNIEARIGRAKATAAIFRKHISCGGGIGVPMDDLPGG
jgi:hypothetical protein